jgi:hypothetical protein
MKTNYNYLTEDEKILTILDLMGAKSLETAVTTEKMLDKAIEEGATKDVFTESWHGHKEGDHPWWLLLAAMSGTGSEAEVDKYDVPYLHRKKIPGMKNGRKTQVYVYWYDESYQHNKNYTGKVWREKMEKQAEIKRVLKEYKDAPKTEEEARAKMANDPAFVNMDGKFVKKEWLISHPEKAQSLYGWWFMTHPQEYKDIYGSEMSNN